MAPAVMAWTPPAPTSLRTEFNPPNAIAMGCEPAAGITLQWTHSYPPPPNDKAVTQAAYQVQILLDPVDPNGTAVWGTGHVTGRAQSTSVVAPLLPHGATLYWRVRAWLMSSSSGGSEPSEWSLALAFDTAPAASTWDDVSWVGGHNQLRAAFTVAGPVKRARVYGAGLGAFYLYVNGQRATDSVMDPPQTTYARRILYTSYDVTMLLIPGAANVVGVQLGNYKWGYNDVWCNMTEMGGPDGCRALALRGVVEYVSAATPDTVLTTTAGAQSPWMGRQGPVTWDHLFHGETFDARLDVQGWSSEPVLDSLPGGASAWGPVTVMEPHGTGFGPLHPTNIPPLRATEKLSPVDVWTIPRPGYGDWGAAQAWIFDFGKNSAGMVTLRLTTAEVKALVAAGVKSLQIEHAELTSQTGVRGGSINIGYCSPNLPAGSPDVHIEPCKGFQTFGVGHLTPDRYIGDLNDANMTNVYVFDPNGRWRGE